MFKTVLMKPPILLMKESLNSQSSGLSSISTRLIHRKRNKTSQLQANNAENPKMDKDRTASSLLKTLKN
jgi:hypothetical protein